MNDIKRLTREYEAIKEKVKNVGDRQEQKALIESAKLIKEQHDKVVEEKKATMLLYKEFKFMKGIDTLEKFKKKIKMCDFWADMWAISILERILNIKFIILSSENYKAKDFANVILCGGITDTFLSNKGTFDPEYYIITEYTGNHYKLIGYKKKLIFGYREIPFDVKRLITDKCFEKNAGSFSLIPEFISKQKQNQKQHGGGNDEDIQQFSEAKLRGMYTEKIVFMFYKNSSDKALPGTAHGEKIPKEERPEFNSLANIPDWRKKLSNSWLCTFSLDNHQWASVEHYYQASKFKENHPEFYLSFSLDSGTDLSKNPELAKCAGSKTGKKGKTLLRPKEVEIDPEFFSKKSEKEMINAIKAKFTQSKSMQKLLLATKNAKLIEYKKSHPPHIADEIMLIRHQLHQLSL